MYTYWKRSAPQPALMAFDTPTREVCVLQRQRTNTPMQALVTLNDDQFVEAARHFAKRILKSGGKTFPEKLNFAFEWATEPTRRPIAYRRAQRVLRRAIQGFQRRPQAGRRAPVCRGIRQRRETRPLRPCCMDPFGFDHPEPRRDFEPRINAKITRP